MSCRELEPLLAEYVDDVLDDADRIKVEQHLAECPHCARAIEELRQLMPMLETLRPEPAPEVLTDNIFAATTRRRPRFMRRRRILGRDSFPLSAAAAILVALIAVVAVYSNLEMHNHLPQVVKETVTDQPMETVAQPAAKLAFQELAFEDEKAKGTADAGLTEVLARKRDSAKTRAENKTGRSAVGGMHKSAEGNGLRNAAYGPSESSTTIILPPPPVMAPPAPKAAEPKREDSAPAMADRIATDDRDEERDAAEEEENDVIRQPLAGAAAETVAERQKARPAEAPAAPEVSIRFFSRQKKMKAADQAGGGEAAIVANIAQRWEGRHSGFHKPGRVVVLTAEKWPTLWQYMNASVIEKPPLPPLDFDKHIVIAVYMGLRSTGGFAISIDQVALVGDHLEVTVQQTTPQPGQMVTQSLTQPYSVVVIPRVIGGKTIAADTPIKFIYR
ncbi:MAG TPA: protease complex subunit PrcB family protein [bacterium]|nr:protease complex subunit PrcB family protein [bacterium]